MYRKDAEERLARIESTIVDLCAEMAEIDRDETVKGRNFLEAPAYIPKNERLHALADERIQLLRVIEGE